MSGVRIRPQADRLGDVGDDSMVIVRDISRPFIPDPNQVCRICGSPHDCKTYHLQLRDGAVIVSETIWQQLRKLYDCGGFELANEVKQPPAQKLIIPPAAVKITPTPF